ncbi:hypothetical protein LXA43DRAFT_971989 [Ganoderma leucocontextum]|nr:hypothetical protein LXA43DRAFT_971989 [Ganoderma leucocontextum]
MVYRHTLLHQPKPIIVTSDNCCHIKHAVWRAMGSETAVCLDVWHFVQRYLACVAGGIKNPLRSAVSEDISGAILKSYAKDGVPAKYWSQAEQAERLEAAYKKWEKRGNVWTAAAAATHAEQMGHVRKGCLARPRDDVRADGSRIEGSHKSWNSLQRSHPSGIETMNTLCHDLVLRRNIRVEFSSEEASTFVLSTHGSHHVHLVNAANVLWNELLAKSDCPAPHLTDLPVMQPANSGETFGMVGISPAMARYHSMVLVKEEEVDDGLVDLSSKDRSTAAKILMEIGMDPHTASLLPPTPQSPPLTPQSPPQTSSSSNAVSRSTPPRTSSSLNTTSSSTTVARGTSEDVVVVDQQDRAYTSAEKGKGVDRSAVLNRKRRAEDDLTSHEIEEIDPSDWHSSTGTVTLANVSAASTTGAASMNTRAVAATANMIKSAATVNAKRMRLTVPGMPAVNYSDMAARTASSSPQHQASSNIMTNFFTLKLPPPSAPPLVLTVPCLPDYKIAGLTRSQHVISVATGINPRCLTFTYEEGHAFFTFMDLRAERKWRSYDMTSFDWLCAASEFNKKIEDLNDKNSLSISRKTPRALLDKLREVESTILNRIRFNNYTSRSGATNFWTKHCHAVDLGNKPQQLGEVNGKAKTRKNHTCGRCKVLMYPGRTKAEGNHGRGICSDGAFSKERTYLKITNGISTEATEHPPPFPQPGGIFLEGRSFSAAMFVAHMESFYTRIIVERATLGIEDLALATMFQQRVTELPPRDGAPSRTVFKLYSNLELADQNRLNASQLVDINGDKYLILDYFGGDLGDTDTGAAQGSGGDV